MTSDIAPSGKNTGPRTGFYTLTLVFAVLTLFFALLSTVLGNRLSALQTIYLNAEKESARSEAASIHDRENALHTARTNLEAAQKALATEKAGTEQLRRKLSAATKDLEEARADLATASRTITDLKATMPAQPAPSVEVPETIVPPADSPSGQVLTPREALPQPAPPASNAPGMAADAPGNQAGTIPVPAVAPLPSDNAPRVAEEPVSDSPPAPPSAAPTDQ